MSYQIQPQKFDNLVASSVGLNTRILTLGAGTYKRGQLLGIIAATGVAGAYDSNATNGLQTPRALVTEDIVIGSGTKEVAGFTAGVFTLETVLEASSLTSLLNSAQKAALESLVSLCATAGFQLNRLNQEFSLPV